jgi:hypothetical protein
MEADHILPHLWYHPRQGTKRDTVAPQSPASPKRRWVAFWCGPVYPQGRVDVARLKSEDPQVLTFSLVTREIGLHAARFEVMRRYHGAPAKILHN